MKIKGRFAILVAFIAIVIGLTAIIKLVSAIDTELTIGLVSLTFGITAILWTLKARKSLSVGSSLRRYTENFLVCLVFILGYSVWHTLNHLFLWDRTIGESMIYPEYAFITMAYLTFVIASYQILYLGKEFGFEGEAKKIRQVIREKKNRK